MAKNNEEGFKNLIKDFEQFEFIPSWVGHYCSYCEKKIKSKEDNFVYLEVIEEEKYMERVIVKTFFCSESCFKTVITSGREFTSKLKYYDSYQEAYEKRDYKRLKEIVEEGGELKWWAYCRYCSKKLRMIKDYHIKVEAEGIINKEHHEFLSDTFCSEECYHNSLDLGPRYLELSKISKSEKERTIG